MITLTVVVTVFIVIALAALALEFGARWFIAKQIKDQFVAQNQEMGIANPPEPEVSFSSSPLIGSLFTKKVAELTISAPDTIQVEHQGDLATTIGTPAAVVRVQDVDFSNPDSPVAGTLTVDTVVPDTFMLVQSQRAMAEGMEQQKQALGAAPEDSDDWMGQLKQGLGELLTEVVSITDLNSNPQAEALDVQFTQGAATLQLQPYAQDGELKFRATNTSLFGIDLPDKVSEAITNGLNNATTEEVRAMKVTSVHITDGGMSLRLEGNNVALSELH